MIWPGKMLKQVLGSIFKAPATTRYPFHKKESDSPDRFRGKLLFRPEMCIGCKMCMRDCPANAITIRKIADKEFEADIDLGKCIYCAQCVDICPKKALEATKKFELASLVRGKLKITFKAEPK
jgi:formate hydrogenlyase subunit 6/NADH:ubiquinone oxidoreductase subunit I